MTKKKICQRLGQSLGRVIKMSENPTCALSSAYETSYQLRHALTPPLQKVCHVPQNQE